jgi:predicted outer membrane repeat protein
VQSFFRRRDKFFSSGNWELQDVDIEFCTASGDGGGIYNTSNLTLSGVTIRNNQAGNYGGGIYGTSSVVFNTMTRCNIYSNSAFLGFDLYGGNSSVICLKKFTIAQPNDYFTYPHEQFAGFSIQQGAVPQINQDVYVSPSGSDENTGLSPESPFKTISHALAWTRPNPDSPNTIHLAPGTYSPGTNGEPYPLYANSHVHIAGQDRESTILGGSQTILRCLQDIDVRVSGVKLGHSASNGIYLVLSDVSLVDFILGDALNPNINSISSTLSMTDGIIRGVTGNYTIISASSGSVLQLMNIHAYNNQPNRLLDINNTHTRLEDCLIDSNSGSNLIQVNGNSHLEMSGSVIRNNNPSGAALAFYNTSTAWFDPDHRSSIHSNGIGKDIRAVNHTGDVIHVVLDTFTVLHPTSYFVNPLHKFTFDILNGMMPQYSQNIYVSPQGSDENTGLTPDDPLRTITRACMIYYPEANARDTIFMEADTYSAETGEQFPVYLAEGLTLYGAGPELTGISGKISNNPIIMIDHSGYAQLKGLTLSGNTYSNGSGLQVSESNVFLDSCRIHSNTRGISITGTSEISANGTEISSNSLHGIVTSNASVSLDNISVINNRVSGLYIDGGNATCNNLFVENNGKVTSSSVLGGLYVRNATVNVMNSSFIGNSATNGGGLLIDLLPDQSVSLHNNIIENNQASQYGGGIYFYGNDHSDVNLFISETTIRKNKATTAGGGLYISRGSVSLDGIHIRENVAQKGGGICFGYGSGQIPYFSGSTIAYNRAKEGGGIYFSADSDYNLEWNTENRCNILMNTAIFSGQDLYSASTEAIYPVVVDTFTVINPGNQFAYETGNFIFDILHWRQAISISMLARWAMTTTAV